MKYLFVILIGFAIGQLQANINFRDSINVINSNLDDLQQSIDSNVARAEQLQRLEYLELDKQFKMKPEEELNTQIEAIKKEL